MINFDEAMTVTRAELEAVNRLQSLKMAEGFRAEGWFTFERMQRHAFEQIAQGKIEILGQSFQDFDQCFFHARADLHALDCFWGMRSLHNYIVTSITI